MVSLRRKKFKVMDEGKQRRSARLLALEEVKNEKAVLALPVDFQHPKGERQLNLRKRGRKKAKEDHEEAQTANEAGPSTNGNSVNGPSACRKPTDRIIGYILDMLEVKDTHELFSMPDNLQTYDYEESMSKPGDFATLRQKHTDGMYTALEQFENDVLTVFRKAIDSNSPDSIPFREAMSMRDQAKQIFQSLKNNLTYAELELSLWHQKYFNYRKRAVRTDGNVGILGGQTAQPECSSHPAVSVGMKRSGDVVDVATGGRKHSRDDNRTFRRSPRPRASARAPSRRAAPIEVEHEDPKSSEEQRRYSYKPWSDSNDSLFKMVCSEPLPLVYNENTLSYEDSLRRFVKDAGPEARFAAEKRCWEYAQRVKTAQSMPPPWQPTPFGSQSSIGGHPFYFSSSAGQHSGGANSSASATCTPSSTIPNTTNSSVDSEDRPQNSAKFKFQTYQLHTDELLTIFSLIGTPDFLQRNLASSSKEHPESDQVISSFLQEMGIYSGVGSVNETAQYSNSIRNSQPVNKPSIWEPRLGGCKPWEQTGSVSPAPRPRLAPEAASSSASARFYEHGSCSFPPKPSNLNLFCSQK